jgi:hypothetical protein
MATPSGANAPYKIVKRGDKFAVVNNAGATKATFDDEGKAREYQKALYANVKGAPKRASKVSFTGKAKDRVKALFDEAIAKLDRREIAADSAMAYSLRPHGFVFPANMPPCSICNQGANGGSHVNPPRTTATPLNNVAWGIVRREGAADQLTMRTPRQTHVYTTGYAGWLANIPCQACRQKMGASCHTPGMPCGPMGTDTAGIVARPQLAAEGADLGTDPSAGHIVMVTHKFEALEGQTSIGDDYKMCAKCGFAEDDEVHKVDDESAEDKGIVPKAVVKQLAWAEPHDPPRQAANEGSQLEVQRAFVHQFGGKLIFSAPANVFSEPSVDMPRELAAQWETASAANPHFMWLEGRYVEADRPNRNMAAWNGDDLEMGEPTIAHGPLNMLHAERHIVGTIAAAALVVPDRQIAANANEPNHIRALSAVWRYLFQAEARQIARASDDRKLWYSMECVSREVACLAEGCTHTQSYVDYMKQPYTRCSHVKQGGPRRFADPHFLGGAIIIPPIRPGWAGANATVMRQAAMLAERQQASFEGSGLTTSEAEHMVAQIIAFAGGADA